MKILVLSTSNPYKAAGIVALDIYKGLNGIEGNQVKMIVKPWDNYHDINIISLESRINYIKKKVIRKLKKLLQITKGSKGNTLVKNPDYPFQDYDQTISYYPTLKILKKINFNPDVIIVLFAQNFLSYKNIHELNLLTGAPIFQYLMDMAPFTGGCHYAWDCRGYTKECGKCPGLFSLDPDDQTHINWKFKNEHISKTEIVVVAASEWQWKQINESSLFEKKKKVKILSPTDSELFFPFDKLQARESLKIPKDKKVIFLGSANPLEKRKGYIELIESFKILYSKLSKSKRKNILVLIAGEENENFQSVFSFEVLLLGYLNHTDLALAYQASDMFLNASIEDSGPTMINQSIMCGTPVVAFEMGVAPDLVKTGITGYLAKLKDSNDLCNGIFNILNLSEPEYLKMTKNCRELALAVCSVTKVAKDFQKLFETKN